MIQTNAKKMTFSHCIFRLQTNVTISYPNDFMLETILHIFCLLTAGTNSSDHLLSLTLASSS